MSQPEVYSTSRKSIIELLSHELPISWRLPILTFFILLSHAIGLAWALGAGWVEDAVRREVRAEIVELRNQVRSLWGYYELIHSAQGRHELKIAGDLRRASERPRIIIIQEPRPVSEGG